MICVCGCFMLFVVNYFVLFCVGDYYVSLCLLMVGFVCWFLGSLLFSLICERGWCVCWMVLICLL